MSPVDDLPRCVECDEWLDPLDDAHAAHELGCPVDAACGDWSCRCDGYAHAACCRACREPVVDAVPVASTRRLPKKRSA